MQPHTHVESPRSHANVSSVQQQKSHFFPLKAKLQISSFSNNADSPITCLIVIDAFDCVKLCHTQPTPPASSQRPSSWEEEHKSRKQHAQLLLLCIKPTGGRTDNVSIETGSKHVVHFQHSVRLMRKSLVNTNQVCDMCAARWMCAERSGL